MIQGAKRQLEMTIIRRALLLSLLLLMDVGSRGIGRSWRLVGVNVVVMMIVEVQEEGAVDVAVSHLLMMALGLLLPDKLLLLRAVAAVFSSVI